MKAGPLLNKWHDILIEDYKYDKRKKRVAISTNGFRGNDIRSVHQWLKQHIRCPSSLWNSEKKYRKEMLKRGFVDRIDNGRNGKYRNHCFVLIHKLDNYRLWLLDIAFADVVKKEGGGKK